MRLQARRATVKIVRFPPGPDGAKVGLDDFLVAHGASELWKLLDAAEEPEAVDAAAMKQPAADILPEDAARRIIHANQQDGVSRLVRWRDGWLWWAGGRYRERSDAEVAAEVTERLNQSWLKVTRHAVGDVLAQLRPQAILPDSTDAPARRGLAPVDRSPRWTCCRHATAFSTWRVLRTARRRISYPRRRGSFRRALISRLALMVPKPVRWLQFTQEVCPTIPSLSAACKRFSGICFPVTRRNRRFSF